jgi:hypothetical protein
LPVPVPASATSAPFSAIALGDALRHLHLLRTRTKAGHGLGQRPLGGEDALYGVHGIRHGGRGMVARDA